MKRIQIDVTEERKEQLENMRDDMGLRTLKDLFDNAMTIASCAIRNKKKGLPLGFYDEKTDTFIELVMPCLEFIEEEK